MNTIVSIFAHVDQAQQARQELLATGFSDNQIDIKVASYKSDDHTLEKQDEDVDVIEKVTAFFRDLFGADDHDIARYAQAGRKGTIITVHTQTGDDAEKVAQILDSFGAQDVAETSGSYAGESDVSENPHPFLDYPVSRSGEHPVTGQQAGSTTRASRLRSRIVARSVEKTNNLTGS